MSVFDQEARAVIAGEGEVWLSADEVGRRLGVEGRTVRRWMTRGVMVPAEDRRQKRRLYLACRKRGGIWQTTPEMVDEFIAATTQAHRAPDEAPAGPTEAAIRRQAAAEKRELWERLGLA